VGGLFTLFAILSSNVDQGSSGKRTTDPNIVSGIVVAYQNLPRGMVIPENAVGFAYVPINVVTNSAYTDPADVVGLAVRSDIPRGGFIYEHNVYRNVRQVGSPVGTPQPTMHSPFPTVERIVISRPDAVEFALELSPQVNVPAGVSPGDSVDIVATTSQQDISLVTTKPISHDAIVTRRTEVQLVLLVSPQESLQLSNSVAQGDQITIMGRAVGDPNIGSAPEINLALILQNQATPTPAP
jgi:Flp pilus assembly protein CpaB